MEKKKAYPQMECSADTLFGFNNQIVLVASTRTCREVQPERVILFAFLVALLVDVQSGENIPVIFRGNGFQGNLQHKNKKKRIRKFALRTRFLINNQIDSV